MKELNNSTIILSFLISSFASIIIFSFEIAPLFETKGLTAFQNDLLCDELALLHFGNIFR